jgi:hypothetical protein
MLISFIQWQPEKVVQLTHISSNSYMNAGKNGNLFGIVHFAGGNCFEEDNV